MKKYKIGILGIGNMGGSILSGIINASIYPNNEICIYDSEDAEDKDFIEKKKGTTPEPSMYIKGEEVYKVTFSFTV